MIDGRQIQSRLQMAEQEEIRRGEEHFMAELRGILTPEAITEGLRVSFGQDKDALSSVLELLGATSLEADRTKGLGIFQAYTTWAGFTSYVGHIEGVLEKLDIPDALDALQMNLLRTGKDSHSQMSYPHLYADADVSESFLSIGHYKDVDGGMEPDLSLPGLRVGCLYRYLPNFYDEFDDGSDLLRFMHERIEDPLRERNSSRIGKLAMFMSDTGETLSMPASNYFLEIGMPYIGGRIMPTLEGVEITKYYELQNGHWQLTKDLDNLDEL